MKNFVCHGQQLQTSDATTQLSISWLLWPPESQISLCYAYTLVLYGLRVHVLHGLREAHTVTCTCIMFAHLYLDVTQPCTLLFVAIMVYALCLFVVHAVHRKSLLRLNVLHFRPVFTAGWLAFPTCYYFHPANQSNIYMCMLCNTLVLYGLRV